eukprot:COSAG06_NODE_636_length_13549_cov_8.611445_3_plen_187_part_00
MCVSQECTACDTGREAASVAATECEMCDPADETDHDLDPATPCVCRPGMERQGSGCSDCADSGRYGVDADGDGEYECQLCQPGSVAMDGQQATLSRPTRCDPCSGGDYDHDQIASTPCLQCGAGQYSPGESVGCTPCPLNEYDHDASAATQCVSCPDGQFSGLGSTQCTSACAPGTYGAPGTCMNW